MLGIQIILVAFALFALARTVSQFRRGRIGVIWTLGWSVVWVAVGIVVFLPNTAQVLARVLGVGRGADLVIYVALISLFFLLFKLFVKIEALERDISTLVRETALEEHREYPSCRA